MTASRGDFGRQGTEPTAADRERAEKYTGLIVRGGVIDHLADEFAVAREEGRREVRAAVLGVADGLDAKAEHYRHAARGSHDAGLRMGWLSAATDVRAAVAPAQPADER